jgi:bifunctional UDP-N-acetylglucosamine pyrophosphorylase/glucosamine-1-phosphate N-acetyltransferase
MEAFPREDVTWVHQTEQLGTGDAVARIGPELRGWSGRLLVLYGDVPLLRPTTLADLMETHAVQGNAATILTAEFADPSGYGRIIRDGEGHFTEIREHADLRPGEEGIREINSGIGVFEVPRLFQALSQIRPDNAQGELYLTDVIALCRDVGERVGTLKLSDPEEIAGVNTPVELEGVGRILEARGAGDREGCRFCSGGSEELTLCETAHSELRLHPDPYNAGHILAVPKRHVIWFSTLSTEERRDLGALAARGERAVRHVYDPPGANAGFLSGASGGLGHFRLEIVPRWGGDSNFMQLIGHTNLVPEDLARTRERLLRALELG